MSNPEKIFEAASALAESLKADINLCKTREEHVRITARANAAATLAAELKIFFSDGEQ